MTNRYFVSIDNDLRDIHAITIIYAATTDEAREIVKKEAPHSIIGVYDKLPALLIEDGTNYVCSAWKPLSFALAVARQQEKVIKLQNELGWEKEKLRDLEGILRKAEDENRMVCPKF